jgi:hypothetical protein
VPQSDIETVFNDGMWTNHVEGEGPTGHNFQTKEMAVDAGRDLARERGVEHIIKKQDGTIGERNSYGHDPRDVSG